jgi:hypothetical protein
MNNQPYLKSCDRCQEEIKMQQINGKWGAYSFDGTSFHKCRKNKNEEKAKAWVKEVMQGPTLEQRVTRLEKITDAFLIAGASSE